VSSVLPSIANEVLKSVVAQYNAIELIGKREAVCPALMINSIAFWYYCSTSSMTVSLEMSPPPIQICTGGGDISRETVIVPMVLE
jgi:hypothetical protein